MSDRPLRLRAWSRSDVGRVRTANEDSFLERPEMGLWVVADGMGGHANGRWASGTIVDAVAPLSASGDLDADIRRVDLQSPFQGGPRPRVITGSELPQAILHQEIR